MQHVQCIATFCATTCQVRLVALNMAIDGVMNSPKARLHSPRELDTQHRRLWISHRMLARGRWQEIHANQIIRGTTEEFGRWLNLALPKEIDLFCCSIIRAHSRSQCLRKLWPAINILYRRTSLQVRQGNIILPLPPRFSPIGGISGPSS